MPDVLLGVDLGTSGVKVVLLDLDGRVRAEASREYPVEVTGSGAAETPPESWWDATVAAVGEALGSGPFDVAAVGVDGQMHGLVLADADGVPTRPAVLWPDTRARGEVAAWEALPEPALRRLANPLVPGMFGPMLRWVRRHEPAAYERSRIALLPKDWLRHRLTGGFATDPSDASATLLWDVPGDGWARDVAAAVGLDPVLLPAVRPSAEPAGAVTAAAASALGVDAGVPVATGAADTAAALLATGLTDAADLQISVGSGAQVVRPLSRPAGVARPRTHVYRAATPSGWYAMAAVQNAGIALDWVRRVLGLSWDELYALRGGPGAGGVTFVPYLTGERSPVLDPDARGAWVGMGLATNRSGLARAAVEGVAFAVRHALEALPGDAPAEARLTGGGAALPAFRTLLADVLGIPLRPMSLRSASAVGAARLAAAAADLPVPATAISRGDPVSPSAHAGGYEEPYRRYLDAVARLRGGRSAAGALPRPG
ncbi:MAG TPA: FGGY family carbohydrate kinase [Streptosporangiales bacterium]